MKITPLLATLALALSLGLPATALAHPKLLSASPAANATVGATKRVTLNFSERLLPKLSGGELVMTGMPGMAAHGPMKVAVTATVGSDGKTLDLVAARPLAAGSYRLDWHVVSTDTHRITGSLGFTVR